MLLYSELRATVSQKGAKLLNVLGMTLCRNTGLDHQRHPILAITNPTYWYLSWHYSNPAGDDLIIDPTEPASHGPCPTGRDPVSHSLHKCRFLLRKPPPLKAK